MNADNTIAIEDLNQFVEILTAWHIDKVAEVRHLLEVPEGSMFSIGDGIDENEIVLSGDTLAGFKFGLEMALMQLGALPFATELEDEDVPT